MHNACRLRSVPARTNDGALPMLDLRSTQEYVIFLFASDVSEHLLSCLSEGTRVTPPVPTLLPAVLCVQGELSCSSSATTADCLSPPFHAHIDKMADQQLKHMRSCAAKGVSKRRHG